MRSDRLLSVLLLLQVYRRLTSRELAARLEVSERTIYRDMDALSAAGVPVTALRGAGGGWTLPESYQTNLTGLNPAEVQALFLAKPAKLLEDLGLRGAAEGALVKLLASLPTRQRQDAEFIRQRIYIDAAGWHPSAEKAPALPVLQDAIWQGRKLLMTYERSDGGAVERRVDPLGLVAKGSAWYLVAAVAGEVRTYRASRVSEARLDEEPCERPAGFDLAAFWQQSAAQFVSNLPRYPAVLRAAPALLPRLRLAGRFARVEAVGPPDEAGWCVVRMLFETQQEAQEYVLGFGAGVVVLEPVELRDLVIEQAQAVVRFYLGSGL